MGVLLTPIVDARPMDLDDLRDKIVAVDGNGELYQFLALIRLRDGSPLADSNGRVTSHLSGLFYRTTRLIADHGLRLVFVFDGPPPFQKLAELQRRRDVKAKFETQRTDALLRGDLGAAYAKATMTSRLTRDMVGEAKELLRLLGVPTVQAPSEGEAQAAHLARSGRAFTAVSKDYDTLLSGAPRLMRFMSIAGREFLPGQGKFRALVPEMIDLEAQLARWRITREGLVDLALLVGTDFNDGVRGIGPKKALKLVQQHGRIEHMPAEIRDAVGEVEVIRDLYLVPDVTDDVVLEFGPPDIDGVIRFLCDEREFSRDRVKAALLRAFPE